MSTDWRALCTELLEALDGWHKAVFETGTGWVRPDETYLIDRARAALAAEADGPAVPEGREPASVVGEPSDKNCWQWYTYYPEEGLEMYSDREQAQSAAQSIMGSYEVAAHSDGWHEDMESVSWGMLVPVEQAQVVERKTAEPGGEFDEWVKYELRPARFGHQPAPPSAGVNPIRAALERLVELDNSWPMQDGRWAWKHENAIADSIEALSAAPPAEGEVGELVEWLREKATWHPADEPEAALFDRAADLLEQRHPAPVPVSERLPGPEDCDAEGRCWWGRPESDDWSADWTLTTQEAVDMFCAFSPRVYWLPATALPLPQGEVQP